MPEPCEEKRPLMVRQVSSQPMDSIRRVICCEWVSDATDEAVKRGHLYQPIWLQYGHACLICGIYIIDVARRETCHDYGGKTSTIPQLYEDWRWSWTPLAALGPTPRRPTRSLHCLSRGYGLDPEKSLYLTHHQPGFLIRYRGVVRS